MLRQYGIYITIAIGTLILVYLARVFFAKFQYHKLGDSDKLQTPSYEEMDSGITLSNPDDEDDP